MVPTSGSLMILIWLAWMVLMTLNLGRLTVRGSWGGGVGGSSEAVRKGRSAPIGRGRDTGHYSKGKRRAMGGKGAALHVPGYGSGPGCAGYDSGESPCWKGWVPGDLVIEAAGVVWVWVVAGA